MLFLLHATRSLGNEVWVDLDLVTEQTGVSLDQVNIECTSLEENGLVVFNVMEGVRITDEGLYIARKLKDWLEWSEKDTHEAGSHRRGEEDKVSQKPKFGFWNIMLSIFIISGILKITAHFF
ncbi:hypothetical protein QAO71_03285 [Halopseudomonas sp. SMJS2]|uniref:hypothetical protein n=1 Tax=Halopseudomonas sp. SMJS2 TaxID=3041098 RepID=UPI0024528154|nr:hypothetical protein [Halopseudomonas sp. SMJS2]WGK62273.1 hypothetical protein QAO71_03285 [Halopseudomonas sp. SMJS2]